MRTYYRLLHQEEAVAERRSQRKHPHYAQPELCARGPNQVWSWDITLLKTLVYGVYYYLYVVIDIYSRCVVGWLLTDRECQVLAEELLRATCKKHGIGMVS